MTDSGRPTLRLKMPVTPSGEARRPLRAPTPVPAAAPRPTAYAQPMRPIGSVRLEPCSRAILEELAALGLADAPEA